MLVKQKEKTMINKLNSVGCGIDKDGIVYPQLQNGEYDLEMGNHISEIDNEEWFEQLSEQDKEIVNTYK